METRSLEKHCRPGAVSLGTCRFLPRTWRLPIIAGALFQSLSLVSGCASVPVIPSELHERVDRRVSFEQVKESPASYQGRLIVVGEAGNGMGPESRDLIVPPANFHLGKYRSKTDIELLIAIEDGVLFSPMHAWRHKLTKEQTRDIIDYIRFFAPVSTDS